MPDLIERKPRARAAVATVVYIFLCATAAFLQQRSERVADALSNADDAQTESVDVRGLLEDTQSEIEELRTDVDELQAQVN